MTEVRKIPDNARLRAIANLGASKTTAVWILDFVGVGGEVLAICLVLAPGGGKDWIAAIHLHHLRDVEAI